MNTLQYRDGALWLIDQTKLPTETVAYQCRTYEQVADAIRTMVVRGAPAIGLTAAYGVALAAATLAEGDREAFGPGLEAAMAHLQSTRPTAVNLFWALERMRGVVSAMAGAEPRRIAAELLSEANTMLGEDEEVNRRMGAYGAELIPDGANVLTHCNAGALATGAFGTAVGVIRAAHEAGKTVHVWVDETRPLLQGARLTAWELADLGIPHTLITDNMAAHFMGRGQVDLVITGADRVAANGDAANKIGTYGVAVLAHAHGIPFYIAAPVSTIDLATPDGTAIPIEERKPEEVATFRGVRTAPLGTQVANPAFDVTPSRLIAGIITERGVARPPYIDELRRAVAEEGRARSGSVA